MRLRLLSALLVVTLLVPVFAVPAAAGYAKVNIDCHNAEIVWVLKQIVKTMHMNLVTDNTVKGQVNLDLRGVAADKALKLVTTVNNLDYKIVYGNTVVVGSPETLSKFP